MRNALALPDTFSITVPARPDNDARWLKFFDQPAAFKKVMAHIKSLPSSETPEMNTYHIYTRGLTYYLDWSSNRLPSEDLIVEFIAHLKGRGLKSNTIAAKYLAPLRHLIRAYANQPITGFTGPDREYIEDCRNAMRAALDVKSPRPETTSNLSPLYRHGVRLSLQHVNAIFRQIDGSTLAGLRDYALMRVAFESAMRLSEITRITLDSITPNDDHFIITVRGKRSNMDPVPISTACYNAILTYVQAFNDGLDPDDTRRIKPGMGIWQALTKSSTYLPAGLYKPQRGMSSRCTARLIQKIVKNATGLKFSAHDTRRTAAALAHANGMDMPSIQRLLNHANPAITMLYVGEAPNLKTSLLTNYLNLG